MANKEQLVIVDVTIPDAKQREGGELTKRAESTLKLAEAFVIEKPEDFTLAGGELAKIGKGIDAIDAHRLDITREIDASKKRIMDKFRPALALMAEAKQILNRKMLAYRDEQARKEREAQAKLDEAARVERERLEKEAAKLQKRNPELAAQKLQEAAQTTAPVVAAQKLAAPGVGTRKTWRAEVIDIKALCRAVLEDKVSELAIEPNLTFLNEQARSLEEHFNARFPGCKAVSNENFGRTRGG